MKYSKEAVMEHVNGYLQKIKDSEEEGFQRQLVVHEQRLADQLKARRLITEHVIDGLQGLESESEYDPYAFQELFDALAEVGEPSNGIHRNQNYFVMEKIILAKTVLVPPVKNTEKSDELSAIVKVFMTGAPPEVGVNDLRAFGLMNLVKYGRP